MGRVIRETLVVTCWGGEAEKARQIAKKLFPRVSKAIAAEVNGYSYFFVPTSGSKLGWEEQEKHTRNLDKLCERLSKVQSAVWVRGEYGYERRSPPSSRSRGERTASERHTERTGARGTAAVLWLKERYKEPDALIYENPLGPGWCCDLRLRGTGGLPHISMSATAPTIKEATLKASEKAARALGWKPAEEVGP